MDLGSEGKLSSIHGNPKEHEKPSEWGRMSFEDSPLVTWPYSLRLRPPGLKPGKLFQSSLILSEGIHC